MLEKALQMNITMSQKYNFGIALAMLTFIAVKGQMPRFNSYF